MVDKQPLRYHRQEFICFLAEEGGRSPQCKARARRQRCWEGLATSAAFPLQTPPSEPPRAPPAREAADLASEAIISGPILGLLPNHLEHLIRGKLRCPEQFWFPIPHSKGRVNPELPSRQEKGRTNTFLLCPAHSFEVKTLTNKQPQPLSNVPISHVCPSQRPRN